MVSAKNGSSERAAATSSVTVAGAVATLWLLGGLVYPLLAIASEDLSAIQLTALRTTGAVILTTPLLIVRLRGRARELFSIHLLWPNFVAGIAFYPIGNGLLTWASSRLPSSLTALAFALLPVLATTVSALRGNHVSRGVWLGVLGAVLSMSVVVGAPGAQVSLVPLAAALASVACWFAGTEFWAAHGLGGDLLISVWLQLAIGALGCWITIGAVDASPPPWSAAFQPVVLFLVFAQVVQHVAYLGVAGKVSPLILTSFALVNPVVAALAGYLLLEQRLTPFQLAASTALLVAVSYAIHASQREPIEQRLD